MHQKGCLEEVVLKMSLASREVEEFWVRAGNRDPPRLEFVEKRV